jgi:hypothetical protein
MPSNSSALSSTTTVPDWLEIVRAKVVSLNYGVVQIVVHDQKVTQIDKTEKNRLDSPKNESSRQRESH